MTHSNNTTDEDPSTATAHATTDGDDRAPVEDPNTATASATADGDDHPSRAEESAAWFATSALRLGIALIGLVLLMVALGQIVGVDFLALFGEVLASSVGRWIIVAVVALAIISFAIHGFGRRAR